MADQNTHHGSGDKGIGSQIRTGLKGIQGAGEAIRGTMMKAADDVFDTKQDNAKNQAIVDKGLSDMKRADEMVGHHHGVKNAGVTTGAGAHSGAPGNVGAAEQAAGVPGTVPTHGTAHGASTAHGNVPAGADLNVPQEHAGVNQRF